MVVKLGVPPAVVSVDLRTERSGPQAAETSAVLLRKALAMAVTSTHPGPASSAVGGLAAIVEQTRTEVPPVVSQALPLLYSASRRSFSPPSERYILDRRLRSGV